MKPRACATEGCPRPIVREPPCTYCEECCYDRLAEEVEAASPPRRCAYVAPTGERCLLAVMAHGHCDLHQTVVATEWESLSENVRAQVLRGIRSAQTEPLVDLGTFASAQVAVSPTPLFTLPAEAFGWAEGIAYSHDGQLLAVAEFTGHKISLLSDGKILGAVSGPSISSPHDVTFSKDDGILGVANRGNATVTLHERTGSASYRNEPIRTFHRPDWIGTTAVSFSGERIVVVDHNQSVTCFAQDGSIVWELVGDDCGFSMPDGLTFTNDGTLLAIANNMSHDVSLYAREGDGYRKAPVARLGGLRHPHSLAFIDDGLIVTNSGGPNISVFRHRNGEWNTHPVTEWPACPYTTFLAAHYEAFLASDRRLACEGGAKGLALHGRCLAWSGPSFGVRAHELEER